MVMTPDETRKAADEFETFLRRLSEDVFYLKIGLAAAVSELQRRGPLDPENEVELGKVFEALTRKGKTDEA